MTKDYRIALTITLVMVVFSEVLGITGIIPGSLGLLKSTLFSGEWVFYLGNVGLHAFILLTGYLAPSWRPVGRVLLVGVALDIAMLPYLPAPAEFYYLLVAFFAGPGLASIAMLLTGCWRGTGGLRQEHLALLGALVLYQCFSPAILSYLYLTGALHPTTFDSVAFRIDASLGFSPSVTVALLFRTHPAAEALPLAAYQLMPFGFSLLYALQVRSRLRWPANVLMLITVSGVLAAILYLTCPITGPKYAFGDSFPYAMRAAADYPMHTTGAPPVARNGMPSMHFALALLLWFNARSLHPVVRGVFAIVLGLTFLATLGLGEHYLIDLVAGVSLALTVQAICTRTLPWSHPARRNAMLAGALLTAAWILAVVFAGAAFANIPGLTWALTIATIGVSAALFANLDRAWPPQVAILPEDPPRPAVAARESGQRRDLRFAFAMFLISGFAGLVYQVLFSKALALTFGSASTATYTVLATYMGGMALGAWVGGMLAERRRDMLRLYALCELGIGAFCLATPAIFIAIQEMYVAAAAGLAPDAKILTVLRVVLGALPLAAPTILMGMTMPLLARFLGERARSLGISVAILYGANTLGAAFGALMAGYAIIPGLGVGKTILFAAAANLIAAFLALRLQKSQVAAGEAPAETAAPAAPSVVTKEMRTLGVLATALLAVGGFVTLALEVNYIHLLAVVAGNSVYAFSLMLFTFLLGLGAGAEAGRRLLVRAVSLPLALGLLEFGLAGVILAGVFMWDSLPAYFASFAGYPLTQSFGAREFVRGLVCWLAMFPAAFFIGALYPVAMECVGQSFPRRRFAALGGAAALNTAGNILGVLVAGFFMLPVLGALRSLQAIAALSLVLGIAAIAFSPWRRRPLAWIPAAGVLVLLAVQPRSFDYTALSSGANVYFGAQPYGTVIDHAESVDGGLTTVAERQLAGGVRSLTLLTNGKFQGNNSGEMTAQIGIAVAPLLHTPARESAVVIGYGTGVSSRTLHDAGFSKLEVVDLSADIVRLADAHFSDINGGVSKRPGVQMHITDGRNFLLLQERTHDLISLEISSIWFAGAASLYNREFYNLVKRRLRPDGVLQQWVQLHHIEPIDILYIIGSAHAEFRHVWLYFIGGQGVIVATNDARRVPARENFDVLENTSAFVPLLRQLGATYEQVSGNLLLGPRDIDRLLAANEAAASRWISTDDNLRLEYSTPKGNVLDGQQSLNQNIGMLRKIGMSGR
jgi:predicted membrane-bound spermidine synthase